MNARWLQASLGGIPARVIVPALMFFSLLGLTLLHKPNWGTPPPSDWTKYSVPKDRAFLAAVNVLSSAPRGKSLQLTGWAAATSPTGHVDALEIYVDGVLAGRTSEFSSRPDVAAAFGRPDFEMSGWRCVVSTQNLKPGEHELQVRILGSNASEVAFTRKLTVWE